MRHHNHHLNFQIATYRVVIRTPKCDFLYRLFVCFQFTVVGPVGLCGAHAREPVGMAGSIVEDIAPILFPNMEEEDATDPALGHVLATSKHAQVNFVLFREQM